MDSVDLKRVLLATDFSDYSKEAARYACALVDKFNAELHILHVFEEYTGSTYAPGVPLVLPKSEQHMQEAARMLVELVEAPWRNEHAIVHVTREGHPFVEIISYARESAIDLIVMGTHGRTGISHLLMGSVAENVVRKSLCPVLTVRPAGHQFVMP